MNAAPNISVIIVNWNAKDYLDQCLDSIRREGSRCSIEIIVVDNSSIDGSQDMIRKKYSDIKLLENNRNFGFSKANNIGINYSSGKYLALINSDVIVKPYTFEQMKKYMDAHSSVGLLGPRIIGIDGNVQRSCMGYPTLWNQFCRSIAIDKWIGTRWFGGQLMTYFNHDCISKVDVINGCFWFVRRETLSEVGLLDERFFIYGEDIDWCKRFKDAGWDNIFYASVEAIHYGGGSSSNSPVRFNVEMQRANYKYWKKHHSRFSINIFVLLLFVGYFLRIITNGINYIFKSQNRKILKQKININFQSIRWLLGEIGFIKKFEIKCDA